MIKIIRSGAVSGILNLPIEALIIFNVFILFSFLNVIALGLNVIARHLHAEAIYPSGEARNVDCFGVPPRNDVGVIKRSLHVQHEHYQKLFLIQTSH